MEPMCRNKQQQESRSMKSVLHANWSFWCESFRRANWTSFIHVFTKYQLRASRVLSAILGYIGEQNVQCPWHHGCVYWKKTRQWTNKYTTSRQSLRRAKNHKSRQRDGDSWAKTWMKWANHPNMLGKRCPGRGNHHCRDGTALCLARAARSHVLSPPGHALLLKGFTVWMFLPLHCIPSSDLLLNDTHSHSTSRQHLTTVSLAWPSLKS